MRFPGSFAITLEDTVEELSLWGHHDVSCDVKMEVLGDHGEVQIEDPIVTRIYFSDRTVESNDLTFRLAVHDLGSQVQDWFVDNDERLEENAREALTDAEEGAKELYWDQKIEERRSN